MKRYLSITEAAAQLRKEFPAYLPVITQTVTVDRCKLSHLYDIDLVRMGRTEYTSDVRDTLEACLNDLREERERDRWDPDCCWYCGGELDGEVCGNIACSINLEAA